MSDPRFEKIGDPITQTIEECAELIHILCKVQRFGWENFHPSDYTNTPNRVLVTREISDVKRKIARLEKLMAEITDVQQPHECNTEHIKE